MLFRRFSLVTACIALLGILVANLIESTHRDRSSFSMENRLNQWKTHDAKRSCDQFPELCQREMFTAAV